MSPGTGGRGRAVEVKLSLSAAPEKEWPPATCDKQGAVCATFLLQDRQRPIRGHSHFSLSGICIYDGHVDFAYDLPSECSACSIASCVFQLNRYSNEHS